MSPGVGGLIELLEAQAAEVQGDTPLVLYARERALLAEVLTLAADVLALMEKEGK